KPLVELLEAEAVPGQRRIAEVVALRAGRQDEVVVRNGTVVGQQATGGEIDACDRRLEEVRVRQRPDQLAHRSRDLTRVEKRGRDLIEQGREEVVIVAVDQQHLDRRLLQTPRE